MINISQYKPELSNADFYVFQITDETGKVINTINIGTNVGTVEDAITVYNANNG